MHFRMFFIHIDPCTVVKISNHFRNKFKQNSRSFNPERPE